jgi:hypothetical protein
MAAPAPADARQIFVFGGNTTVQLDAALLTPYGIVVERRGSAKPSPAGLRFKIVDGRTTLEYPPAGKVLTVGSMALVQGANNITFTWFHTTLGKKPRLSARVGVNSGWGPRMTPFRLTLSQPSFVVEGQDVALTNIPITLTAAGASMLNAHFVAPGQPPFTIGQPIGVLNVKTRWYFA